ncbi:predicted protein, partial [Nematostella vectensis]
KLSKLHKPQFIRDISIKDLSLGNSLPIISRVSLPVLDERGTWIDFDVTYSGGLVFTLETYLNVDGYFISIELNSTGRVSPVQKQSSNEDEMSRSEPGSPTPGSGPSSPIRRNINNKPNTKRKVISVIERLAKSKWVKKAAETKIVKSAAEKFSNLPIILSVEVQTVKGTLAINIPPPPTNRLWYGFRGNPMLFVSARPKLGARQVKLTHVTDWIEKKLKQEFKNMFVLPNMEDLPIKLMKCDVEQQFEDS